MEQFVVELIQQKIPVFTGTLKQCRKFLSGLPRQKRNNRQIVDKTGKKVPFSIQW